MATAVQRAPGRVEQFSPASRRETTPTTPPATDRPERLMSLDAYRGFIMIAMASSGLGFPQVAQTILGADAWEFLGHDVTNIIKPVYAFLGYQFDHATWVGCSFWDLIQPSFMFMVGVAMPYSLAGRRARGESKLWQTLHVIYRAVLLTLLGVFLSSNGAKHTDFTFVNVLSQIGLGYAFVYLLAGRGWKLQLGVLTGILVGYWLLFALWPVSQFDLGRLSAEAAAKEPAPFDGFFAHWNKNANAASWFDDWFLNLFPQGKPFDFNRGGYQTLNFIPSMGTMIFGLMAGEWLRTQRKLYEQFFGLLVAGVALLVIGSILGVTVCPLVKRIWTPSWAVFSTGWTLILLAGFFWIIDVQGWRRWSLPLIVVGMNSIAMYMMSQLMRGWTRETFKTHLGQDIFSGTFGPMWERIALLAVFWLICLWLYRRKIFIRI
jgi:predicted acyltransferase